MSKIKYIVVIALLVLGCKKEESRGEMNFDSDVELRLKEIHHNDTLYNSHIYNSDNLLDRTNWYNEFGEQIAYWTYEYTGDSIQERVFWSDDEMHFYRNYYEVAEGIVRMDESIYLDWDTSHWYQLYYFMDSECGYNDHQSYDSSDSLTNESLIEFFGSNCNRLFTFFSWNGDVSGTGQVIRDYGKTSYSAIRNLLLTSNTIGNVTEASYWNASNELNPMNSYTAVFTYNLYSYPTNEIRTYANGEVLDIDYFYY